MKLNIDYVADKFGADKYFDLESTIADYKNYVIDYRKRDEITQEEARELFNDIKELEDIDSKESFVSEMWHKSKLMSFFDHQPDVRYDITPQFKSFWKNCWVAFCEEIKCEIEKEKSALLTIS